VGWSPALRRVVANRRRLNVVSRRTPTVSSGRKAAVLGARGRVLRTPPGSESRAGRQRGDVGTWEHPLSPCDRPGEGDRAPPGPGVAWGLPPGCAPRWDPTHATEARKGSGSERQAKRPATGREGVVAAQSPGAGGEPRPMGPTGGQAPPGSTRSGRARRERPCAHQPSHHNSSAWPRRPPTLPIVC
jgi:hypothetical protein